MNVAENANTAFSVEFGDLHGFVDNTFQILSMMNHDFADFANRALQVSHRIGSEYSNESFSTIHLSSVESSLGLFILFIPNLSLNLGCNLYRNNF